MSMVLCAGFQCGQGFLRLLAEEEIEPCASTRKATWPANLGIRRHIRSPDDEMFPACAIAAVKLKEVEEQRDIGKS